MMPKAFPVALLAALFGLSAVPASASDVPNVVVSVKPVHSLVASVMEGVAAPKLIVEGAASPHTYTMKPTNAQDLQDADVVFWLGHSLEAFLEKPLEALSGKAKVISFLELDGVKTLAPRESGTFEQHEDEHHDHTEAKADEEIDAHIWLDPDNAKTMTRAIAMALSEVDPDNAKQYAANAEAEVMRLDTLSQTIAAMIAPVKDKPFIVFHDAYQYFENRFGVRVAGSITVSPETVPGAARISEIHQKVKDLGATCVFSEPQFEPKLVNVVMEGSAARTGILDPEGASLEAGKDLYSNLMLSIAKGLKDCLAGG